MNNQMKDFNPFPLINKDKKFILFTNAKCGGTLLKIWFLETLNLEHTFSDFQTARSNYGLPFVLCWYRHHYGLHAVDQIFSWDNSIRRFIKLYRQSTKRLLPKIVHDPEWFRIAVIRNPYNRLVSAFVDKFCGHDVTKRWVRKVLKTVNSRDAHGTFEISFVQFVEYLESRDIDRENPHWRRQTYILNGIKFERVVELRNMAHAFPDIERELGLSTTVDFLSQRQSKSYGNRTDRSFVGNFSNNELIEHRRKTNRFPSKAQFYNDELRARVRNIYQADFEMLDYDI